MFIRLIAESMRRSPGRKAMAAAAVAMGCAVATAMLGVMLDVGDRMNRELRSLGANLAVRPRAQTLPVEIGGVSYRPVSSEEYLNDSDVPKIKTIFWHLNVTSVAPSLKSVVRIRDIEAPVEGVWFQKGLRASASAWKVDGQWVDDSQPDPNGRECMIGSALARRLGVSPGSDLALFGKTFHVQGVLTTGDEEEDRVFVRLEALQQLTGRPGRVTQILVGALTKPEDEFARKDPAKMTPVEYDRWYCTPYVTSIAHQIEEVIPAAVARPIWRVADNEGRVLGKIRGLLLLVALAALISAGLTVWSVTATTVMERRSEIAIMQAMGATDWSVGAVFAAELGILGAVGGIAGSVAGAQLAHWVGRAVFDLAAQLPPLLAPLVVLLAVLLSLAGAAQPLRRALQAPPAAVLRGDA
ncbi:MAG: FtsX-like permease family protein [Bryobacteraceae bacterium]